MDERPKRRAATRTEQEGGEESCPVSDPLGTLLDDFTTVVRLPCFALCCKNIKYISLYTLEESVEMFRLISFTSLKRHSRQNKTSPAISFTKL